LLGCTSLTAEDIIKKVAPGLKQSGLVAFFCYSVSYDDDCTLDNETYAGMEGLFMTAPWKVVKTIKTTIKESESVGVVCFALVVEMSVEGVLTVVNMKIHFVLFRSMLTSGLHINYQESEELGYSK